MKKCPICNVELNRSNIAFDPRKHVIKCARCGRTLRKRVSIWFLPLMLVFGSVCANFQTHWVFKVLTIILGIALVIFYNRLPYVPYDNEKL